MYNPAGYWGTFPQGVASAVPAGPSMGLTNSGPIVVGSHSQVIEGLRFTVDGVFAIEGNSFNNVIVRGCEINHINTRATQWINCDDLTFEDVAFEHTGTASPIATGAEENQLHTLNCDRVIGTRLRFNHGTSGGSINGGSGAIFTFIEGKNQRNIVSGFKGNLIQFVDHPNPTLTDFSVFNNTDPAIAYPGDNVSFIRADNSTVRRGLIDGGNSNAGVGMMFEGCAGALVEDVDFLHMSNGSASNWDASGVLSTNIVWTRIRSKDNTNVDFGRGLPTSGALIFAANQALAQTTVKNCLYFNEANPGNTYWKTDGFVWGAITSVTNNGGQAVFNEVGHGRVDGDTIRHTGFASNAAYVGASFTIVNATTNTYEIGVAYGSNDTGEGLGIAEFDFTPRSPIVNVYDWE